MTHLKKWPIDSDLFITFTYHFLYNIRNVKYFRRITAQGFEPEQFCQLCYFYMHVFLIVTFETCTQCPLLTPLSSDLNA